MEEIWKEIEGFGGQYLVSNTGKIRTMAQTFIRSNGVRKSLPEKEMKPYVDGMGYKALCLRTPDGKKVKRYLHRLLAQAFIPNTESKPVINHKNGNKLDNSLANLEWATYSENNVHAVETGLRCVAARSYKSSNALLSKEDREFILNNYTRGKSGFNSQKLANLLGVSKTTVLKVIKQGWDALVD